MDDPRRLLVLYGSQTGTAQEAAERLCREGERLRFDVSLSPMDEYKMADLVDQGLAVFVAATTGQGDEPDNMKKV